MTDDLRGRIAGAVMVVARMEARKEVLRRYQAKGVKVNSIPRSEVFAEVNQYIREHPKVIERAKEIVRRYQAQGLFGKKAAALPAPAFLATRPAICALEERPSLPPPHPTICPPPSLPLRLLLRVIRGGKAEPQASR